MARTPMQSNAMLLLRSRFEAVVEAFATDMTHHAVASRANELQVAAGELKMACRIAETDEIADAISEAKRTERRAREAFRKIDKRIGLEVDRPDRQGTMFVYPPDGLYEDESTDPYCGDHCADNWVDALAIAQVYEQAFDKQQQEKKS